MAAKERAFEIARLVAAMSVSACPDENRGGHFQPMLVANGEVEWLPLLSEDDHQTALKIAASTKHFLQDHAVELCAPFFPGYSVDDDRGFASMAGVDLVEWLNDQGFTLESCVENGRHGSVTSNKDLGLIVRSDDGDEFTVGPIYNLNKVIEAYWQDYRDYMADDGGDRI